MSFAQAEVKYLEATLTTFSLTETTKKTGRILPTTPFEIISKKDNKLIVKITGWYLNGEARILYFSKGKKIMSAVFAKNANNKVEKLETKDIDGSKWEKVSISTLISEGNYKDSIDVLMKKGSDLFQTNCSLCHPAPDINHFNPRQWPSVAKEMGSRTPLSKDEIALLSQYLQKTTKAH
jgi:trimethylamine-N-oxide reductase cytochrome c-type subunit TorC